MTWCFAVAEEIFAKIRPSLSGVFFFVLSPRTTYTHGESSHLFLLLLLPELPHGVMIRK